MRVSLLLTSRLTGAGLAMLAAGCISRPPTIAHVHIGHAVTGVHVTPNHEGYMVMAQRRAQETVGWAEKAAASHDLQEIKKDVAAAVEATGSVDNFGLREALIMAVNHITFAASSDDA